MIGLWLLKAHLDNLPTSPVALLPPATHPPEASHAPATPPVIPRGYLGHQGMIDYVRGEAHKRGLDAAAMLAVAEQEGLGGAIGDGGLAYGPWQDHLTEFHRIPFEGPLRNNDSVQAWAWSAAGADFVMRSMVAAGAGGLTGYDAIARIVTHYERPREDLRAGEIARAWANYQGWKA